MTKKHSFLEALKGNQHKIDKNKNNKIDSQDFKILRGEKKVEEEVDVNDRTEDQIGGRIKTAKKDDVGPGSNFKSTKVRFHAGPKNESYTLKSFRERYEEHSIYDQMIQEVLGKDASAGDWIHDFVHSDNPKFKGKSKEMRKKMALAAYYAKQRNEEVEQDICPECMQEPCVCGGNHVQEEVEQIDEGKMDKMSLSALWHKHAQHTYWADQGYGAGSDNPKHAHHAATAIENHVRKHHGNKVADDMVAHSDHHVAHAEYVGGKEAKETEHAAEKLRKKHGIKGNLYGMQNESVEQIDELSKGTLGSYVKGAARDMAASRGLAKDFERDAKSARKQRTKDANKRISDRFMNTVNKRHAGIGKAVERLTKEETEQVEENAFDWKKPRPPESKGGSGVKLGSRYGGGKQKDKPEQDDDKKKVTESKRPETDSVPFVTDVGVAPKPATVTDKSGAKHTPMSRAKHLARLSMKKIQKDLGQKK